MMSLTVSPSPFPVLSPLAYVPEVPKSVVLHDTAGPREAGASCSRHCTIQDGGQSSFWAGGRERLPGALPAKSACFLSPPSVLYNISTFYLFAQNLGAGPHLTTNKDGNVVFYQESEFAHKEKRDSRF